MIDTRLNTAYLQQLERKAYNITQVVPEVTHTRAGFTFKFANKAGRAYMLEFYYDYKDVTNSKTVCVVKCNDSAVKFVDSVNIANINNLRQASELLTSSITAA